MRIAVPGPLEVRTVAGQPVEVAGSRLRTLLVRLALDSGRVVTIGQLVDAVRSDELIGQAALALAEGRPEVTASLLRAATWARGAADQSVPDRARIEQADQLRLLANRPQGTLRSGA